MAREGSNRSSAPISPRSPYETRTASSMRAGSPALMLGYFVRACRVRDHEGRTLRPGMGFAVGPAQVSRRDVGVDLGGAERRVPEQTLYDPEVGPAFGGRG